MEQGILRRGDGSVVCERCSVATTAVTRLRGLLGRSSLPAGEGILLRPAGSIHTAFMRFPIDAVFLDRDLTVVAIKPDLGPWRIAAVRSTRSVLELPAGESKRRRLSVGERLELSPSHLNEHPRRSKMNLVARLNSGPAREESGQVAALLAVLLVVLLGMAALAIDLGHAYYTQRSLQASADAAALAGAQELPDGPAAVAIAQQYSGKSGAKNERANVAGVTTSVATKCLAVAPCAPVNAVAVTETVKVETRFARVLGIDTFDVRATSTACSPCATRPLDVMLVLDRTLSMCMDSWGNYQGSCPDLTNAKNGLRTFIGYMDPTLDKVGLAVFPPATSSGANCSTPALPSQVNTPAPPHFVDSNYSSGSYPYVLAPLATDYKTGNSLNGSSRLVSTVNCLKAGGVTAYALAIEKAQAELNANGRANVQDVIVFFSDGAANYGPAYSPYGTGSPYRTTPCHQGVASAGAVKATGTLIFAIGYDLDAEGGNAQVCKSHTGTLEGGITATSALQQIASDADSFFNQPTPGELNTIYTKIAGELAGARLIDDSIG